MDIPNAERIDRLLVRITDMNVHSINLREKLESQHSEDSLHLLSQFKHFTSQDLYSCKTKVAIPILHDTAIDLRLALRFLCHI